MDLGQTARWNLTTFYPSPESVEVATDLAKTESALATFAQSYRGKLDARLGDALTDYISLSRHLTKLSAYFHLCTALNTTDAALRKSASRVHEKLSAAQANHLSFFDLEIARLPEASYRSQLSHPVVAKHKPMLDHIRAVARHMLPEDVEQTLTLRSPFGPAEWSDLMDELESNLRVPFDGGEKTLPEALHILGDDPDATRRATILKNINTALNDQKLTFFQARTLNAKAGDYAADLAQRGYSHILQPRNLANKVDDATVQALHEAVATTGATLCQRFYRLKAKLLGKQVLAWSDRNAPMPFKPQGQVSWPEAQQLVQSAYQAFSPTLGALVQQVFDAGWTDVPPSPTKVGGAFDYTMVLPSADGTADGEDVRSYMLLNFLGSPRDVMTLAHELGHAVHGLLATKAQGPLQWHAPMVYAETASIFGEMLTFEHLLAAAPDDHARLALLMEKSNDALNSVVRQISFSLFEQGFHSRRPQGKLTQEDFTDLWMETTRRFYGPEGEVFTYENMENMWAYIGHFHSYPPFYVYAYAFGELFTQSLMGTRASLGERFEPLYLDLLRAGDTRNAIQLMEPFGLNPADPAFWHNGLTASLGKWLDDAEATAARLKLV